MAKTRKPLRKRRSLKLRAHREPAPAAQLCLANIAADEEAGIIGSVAGPAAIFASGASRKSRPMRGGALSAGDEIIQSQRALPSPILSIGLTLEEFSTLQSIAAERGYATAADLVRSLLLPHLTAAGQQT